MIIRCDNCSVSLQVDESKIPTTIFTVRCPRCQNMLRANKESAAAGSPASQLEASKPAPPVPNGPAEFEEKESEQEINQALRSLLSRFQHGGALSIRTTRSVKKLAVCSCASGKNVTRLPQS